MDVIDRQAAIDALAKVAREKFNLSDEFYYYLAGLVDGEYAIKAVPSAQKTQLSGEDATFDCISRQAAKDAIDIKLDEIDHVPQWVYDKLLDALNDLPSAEPERPTGLWLRAGTWHDNQIWECSKCDSAVLHDGAGQWNYCPVCGSRNEVEHD